MALCIVIFTPPEVGPRVTEARSLTLYLHNPKRIHVLRKVENKVNIQICTKIDGGALHWHLHPTGGGASRHGGQVTYALPIQSKENSRLAEGREQGEYTNIYKNGRWHSASSSSPHRKWDLASRGPGNLPFNYNPKRIPFLRKVENMVKLSDPSKTPPPCYQYENGCMWADVQAGVWDGSETGCVRVY